MKQKIKNYCEVCGKLIGEFTPSVKKKSCSEICKKKLLSKASSGKNNCHYKDGRSRIQNFCQCGKPIQRGSQYCHKCRAIFNNSFKGKHHSKKSKIKIGQKSSEKFTDNFKIKLRKSMEKFGHWIPLNQKDEFKLYADLSNWISRMFDRHEIKGYKKLKNNGVFNCRTNTKGVVRDHKFSRKSGFELKVFPEILRHPANCEILLHGENVAKKQKRYVDNDSITLNELFIAIKNFKGDWSEQNQCLQLIQKYEKGERYNKDDYIQSYYEENKSVRQGK